MDYSSVVDYCTVSSVMDHSYTVSRFQVLRTILVVEIILSDTPCESVMDHFRKVLA